MAPNHSFLGRPDGVDAVLDLALALVGLRDVGELNRALAASLGNLPGVRGACLYLAADGAQPDRPFDRVLETGPVMGGLRRAVPKAAASPGPTTLLIGERAVRMIPLTGGVCGVLVLDVEADAAVPGPLDRLGPLLGGAFASARLFGTLKGRIARLERGTLERQRQLARLMMRNDRLVDARDGFLALLHHDLRSPISIVLGQCELIEQGVLGERMPRAVEAIRRQAERMGGHVEDLLLRYRQEPDADRGTSRVEVLVLVREMVETYVPVAAGRGQVIRVVGADVLGVEADVNVLRDALGSLLDHALAATPEGGNVAITVAAEGEMARIDIHDGGPGLGSGALDLDGSGREVGLRSSVRAIQAHAGRVRASDHPEGGGLVTVLLPRTTLARSTPRVFVLSADLDRLESWADVLGPQWDVECASDPAGALDALVNAPPDVVVLDLAAGASSETLDLFAMLKAEPALAPVPVVAVVPHADPAAVDRAHGGGALTVLPLPLDAALLVANVRHAFRAAARTRASVAGRASDPLTGLETAAFVNARLPGLAVESRAAGVPLPVVLLDVVDLRAVNRAHGWSVGDQLLMWLGGALRDGSSPGEIIARGTGDEFVLVLPNRSLADAAERADGIRELVERARPRLGVARIAVRVMADVVDATLTGGAASVDSLFDQRRGERETPDGT